jgi:hypothetical protein
MNEESHHEKSYFVDIPLSAVSCICAASALGARRHSISSRDRVYAADRRRIPSLSILQHKLLGVIRLESGARGFSALYKGQLLVHGLGYSPNSKTLAVVSVGSNSVTLIGDE